jgi:hypothetical protein
VQRGTAPKHNQVLNCFPITLLFLFLSASFAVSILYALMEEVSLSNCRVSVDDLICFVSFSSWCEATEREQCRKACVLVLHDREL